MLVAFLLSCASVGKNQPVYSILPPIAEEFYECSKCGSYDGGIYGKGPLKHYRTPQAEDCRHDWIQISRGDFATRVSRYFGVDWSAEPMPYWQNLASAASSKGPRSLEAQ